MKLAVTIDARVDPTIHPNIIDLKIAILEALGAVGLYGITLDLEEE